VCLMRASSTLTCNLSREKGVSAGLQRWERGPLLLSLPASFSATWALQMSVFL
jgi:hypothetical protein